MLKTIVLFAALTLIHITNSSVWICLNPASHKYHSSSSCNGFKRCKHDTAQVSIADAKSRGYAACAICY